MLGEGRKQWFLTRLLLHRARINLSDLIGCDGHHTENRQDDTLYNDKT